MSRVETYGLAAEGMFMSGIKVGDTVRLKSGGPAMMVNSIGDDWGGVKVATCEWFDTKQSPQEKSFALTSLEIA